ncbi:UvrD-helicase domain-containing protein [Ectobacillus ponti]|uniref:DNA 3'-5' helicase n=1 Tax=Ectobacillus ponti TaxID=2961894 RepID=A0AA41XF31_9BACI|nr:UvrD-helicase domain-containing protein [Ectobacillus ponti]MCP8970936.1 UvrD-helicase domain-containing protein [Ectobacillus ponti]
MFIPTALQEMPGLNAELHVWDAVTRAFNEQSTLAIHHYPMFFANGSGRREIDILIVDKRLGVCVIEVKGITIDQVDSIQGHQWSYRNFYEEKGSPFQQAEKQLHMLSNHLETNPLLYRRFSKRVWIALPYITEREWRERGFHEQIHVPLPLFQEDLADAQRLREKLQTFALFETNRELSGTELAKISGMLGIQPREAEPPAIEPQLPFSNLYIVPAAADFKRYQKDIANDLQRGTKVYMLAYTDVALSEIAGHEQQMKSFQLNVYRAKNGIREPLAAGCFTDGKGVNAPLLKQMAEHFPDFNSGQFKAIHQSVDAHQMITAGAGTGKTHVMIDRILFLLMNGGISLKHIIMITFTNASTNEMKKRLEDKFLALFKLTQNRQFLAFAEEVKDMQISTIHSFARSILKQLAHEIGYGQNVQLRSFTFEKKRIIYELLDEFFAKHPIDHFLAIELKDYEFVDAVYGMWEEMEKKSLTSGEMKQLDWGGVSGENAAVIQSVLQYIFANCEDRLDQLKQAENAITMGDLIRKLKLFTGSARKMGQLPKDQFMFVDEFQDSDATQIELLASLLQYLQYRLFVVGDIKQAIYRFRGADYKSFEELQEKTKETAYVQTELQLNYRSSSSLLDRMHTLFAHWNEKKWLAYEEGDRLRSNEASQFPKADWHVSSSYEEDFTKALETLPGKGDKIAFIVRTNRHAKKIKEYCAAKGIPTTENLDGTFFTSAPVLDFRALVEGLLYPHEPKFVLNALQTPYFGCRIPYQALLPFGGHRERLISFLHERTRGEFKGYVSSLRTLAPLTVIQKIIFDKQLFARLPQYMEQQLQQEHGGEEPSQEAVELAALRYKKNLQHLMVLLERTFSAKHVTMQMLRDWLQLQISTNRTENEPVLEQDTAQVEITTVHRSKGLEYHTVFLPITNSPFNAVEQQYFVEEASVQANQADRRKFGWKLKSYANNHFPVLKKYEDIEQFKEETRLLYVALTRAEQRVYITMPKKIYNTNCWAYILEQGGLRG